MPTSNQTSRNTALDTLRTLSILFVIAIHTAGRFLMPYAGYTKSVFLQGAVIESLVQWGVPLFVMLSGAFVLGGNDSVQKIYGKRLPKLFWPLLLWLPVNWLWVLLTGGSAKLIQLFLHGQPFMHLWFMVMLIGLYLIIPLLNRLIKKAGHHPSVLYILVLFFMFIAVLWRLYIYRTAPTDFNLYMHPLLFLQYTGYFLAGYVLRNYPLSAGRSSAGLYVLLMFAAWCFTFLMLLKQRGMTGNTPLYLLDNFSPGSVLGSISLFSLMCHPRMRKMKKNILSGIHAEVMGIYLMHLMAINLLERPLLEIFPQLMNHPVVFTLVIVLGVTVLCFAGTRILRSMVFFRRFV